jgi:hypothetical protein
VRLAAYAAVSLSLVALAGCDGNGDGNGDSAWAGPPEPAADGSVSVAEFAEYQDGVEERWEASAELIAAEFLRLDDRTAVRTTIAGVGVGEGAGPRTVTVTFDGLLDDSVRGERWTLVFEPEDEGYRLESAVRTLRCQPSRGHDDFTPEPCV